jgi:roadblock/LC7 domain-containing protein
MILQIAALVLAAGAGFGAGRVKNAGKLAAIKAEVNKVQADAKADFAAAVAKIKTLV